NRVSNVEATLVSFIISYQWERKNSELVLEEYKENIDMTNGIPPIATANMMRSDFEDKGTVH
ncbi:hypothetical protein KI387_043038, partial [Taxus chinensis]